MQKSILNPSFWIVLNTGVRLGMNPYPAQFLSFPGFSGDKFRNTGISRVFPDFQGAYESYVQGFNKILCKFIFINRE